MISERHALFGQNERAEAEALGWGHAPQSEDAFQQMASVERLRGQFNLALRASTRQCFKVIL